MTSTQSNVVFSQEISGISSRRPLEIPGAKARILIADKVSEWTPEVTDRLEALIKLPYGWDGYQGQPVSFVNANFALQMLNNICGLETRAPQIVPGAAGDLQIEWHTLQGDIELHVKGPNNVHAWRAVTGGDSEGEELDLTVDFAIVAVWVKDITEPPIAASATA